MPTDIMESAAFWVMLATNCFSSLTARASSAASAFRLALSRPAICTICSSMSTFFFSSVFCISSTSGERLGSGFNATFNCRI